jgi:hypothetical protein
MSEPRSLPSAEGGAAPAAERRAAVRYRCQLRSPCRPVPEGEVLGTARVVDVSAAGVGLLLDRPVEPETLLEVELQGAGPSLLVEVRHCWARPGGGWLVGCAFARKLSPGELRVLLERPPGSVG